MNRLLIAIAIVVSLLAGGATPSSAARSRSAPQLPMSMAAVGDSITAATDVGWCCVNPNGSNPQYSWSTGSSRSVDSHAMRIAAMPPGKPIGTVNMAKPGADSGNLAGQLNAVTSASPQVGYVTVLMGGNDLCVPTLADMTAPDLFENRVRSALAGFFQHHSNALMLVASIPNLYRLWKLERNDLWAVLVWNRFGVCPTMLSISNSESERQQVVAREQMFNQRLAKVCDEYRPNCRWDGYAVYNASFTRAGISPVDHYHPSVAGQRLLASVTWGAGFWGNG